MTKKKYKDLDAYEKFIKDAIGQKWISVISLSAFFILGCWMILEPKGFKHASIEKSTVYLAKELWSLEFGIFLVVIASIFLIKVFMNMKVMKGFTWVKQQTGFYIFNNQQSLTDVTSLYDGNDLIVFNCKQQEVYRLVNYAKTKINRYKKVQFENEINCMDAYWSATHEGYYLYYKGVHQGNLTSEYKGDDLIVTANDIGKSFRLKNYKANLNNKIRIANRY